MTLKQTRFRLRPCDGVHGASFHVYNTADLEYWKRECARKGYTLRFDYHDDNQYKLDKTESDIYLALPKDE